ncbi:MAG: sigma-70 family RNA polymerase sigma factor [Solirubrobacteraceae bacterium]
MEREYLAHRSSVLAMLHAEFRGIRDHEELYQEAWAEALELQARGQEIANLGGLLRTIAWRRARDRLRKNAPEAIDPASQVLLQQLDPAALPEENIEIRLDAALIRQVVESLEPRQAAAIKLRFDRHLDSKEIQAELGVSPKRLEKIVTEAYACVERALDGSSTGLAQWRRRQRSLLLACETGLASSRQRRQARQMLKDDPACRAMLAEIRSALEQVAAIIPLPLLVERAQHSRLAQLRLGIAERFAAVRDQLADVVARLSGHGAAVEQAGVGGAISLGGGAVVKAALACFALTGGTVVCLTVGLRDGPKPPKSAAPAPHRAKAKSRLTRVSVPVATVTKPRPVPQPRHSTEQQAQVVPAAAAPPPSPTPTGSTEFGPGTTGSTSAPTTPAAAPVSGSDEFQP